MSILIRHFKGALFINVEMSGPIRIAKPHRTEDALESTQVSLHFVHHTSIAVDSGCFVGGCVSRSGPTDGDILVVPTTPKGLLLPHAVTEGRGRLCSAWVVNATPKRKS